MKADFPMDRFVFDKRVWPRIDRDAARVAYLADVLTTGATLPPVKVQRGSGLVLGGWHTIEAYARLHRQTVPVEVVDVSDHELLLYAYREDVDAALPYSTADVRSVARRLYQQRSNGRPVNVEALARDLGRARKTVAEWVADLVADDAERESALRTGRAVAARAFIEGAKCSQRRAAELLGVDHRTLGRNGGSATVPQFPTDDHTVEAARGLIAESAGRESTPDERRMALDWILEQTNPEALAITRQSRALSHALEWTGSIIRQLQGIEIPVLAAAGSCPDADVRTKHQALRQQLADIRQLLDEIERGSL
jgi:hypothetical protein